MRGKFFVIFKAFLQDIPDISQCQITHLNSAGAIDNFKIIDIHGDDLSLLFGYIIHFFLEIFIIPAICKWIDIGEL